MMCAARSWLMTFINDASVVDLPEPVIPVTSTSPRCSRARSRTRDGRFSRSNGGISAAMTRMTMPVSPRCLKTLTR